ncbi:hypothetical protein [Chitinophaga silvisoli]|uniref:Uncharacterized protein n=1 Tax=Chitinophaga silvisoli TaxID=2291814 RepID=A0A3E1P8E0_9BACT|nr:hypothetical protein [Chitinophaga silvisoli]RFM36443.1 hypothetical protein DXN04_02770 [Chitinophaga silvisoli]
MREVKMLLLAMILYGCVPSFKSEEKDRLYLKEISSNSIKLKWFFYSTVSSETPDYITIQKGSQIDTICIANNVADLKFQNDIITIGFYGNPQKYTVPIEISQQVMSYEVIIDTTFTIKSPIPRKFYKKIE